MNKFLEMIDDQGTIVVSLSGVLEDLDNLDLILDNLEYDTSKIQNCANELRSLLYQEIGETVHDLLIDLEDDEEEEAEDESAGDNT